MEIQVTTRETATAHGRSVRTIQRRAQHGKLPAVKVAGRWQITITADLDGFKPAQIERARELLDQGGLIAARRPGLFTAVSSDGSGTYLTHTAVCSCPAGRRGRACYHVAAVRLVLALVGATARPLVSVEAARSPIALPARPVPVRGGPSLDVYGEYEYALERAS